ncbi:MAG: aminoglycoside phosphotransferase family protein [Clostridia bacterium]|nr:aminoglycoside phosphotransferase family protein [Clostridia bacterium]MBR5044759.1 aminoglycoside phosphotransferase family protein [Clostridia bacterium]
MPEPDALRAVLSRFAVDSDDRPPITPFGNGHIHSTYLVGTVPPTVLQRINRAVFPRPDLPTENAARVTEHLRKRIAAEGGDPLRETLTLIPDRLSGLPYVVCDGEFYRLTVFVPGAVSHEVADPDALYRAAKTYGRFLRRLSDFPANSLSEVLPGFHDTRARLAALREAIGRDPVGRVASVGPEIDFVLAREGDCGVIVDGLASGEIPVRVTHNDTKLNNFLFDEKTGECIALIDLDTVMPGSLLYDYGDALRFAASNAPEDETDLSRVFFREEKIAAFTRGLLAECGDELTPRERALLPFSIKLLTLECGMRFLTDYIAGDVYFKTDYPAHNLDRARNQFALVRDVEPKLPALARLTE